MTTAGPPKHAKLAASPRHAKIAVRAWWRPGSPGAGSSAGRFRLRAYRVEIVGLLIGIGLGSGGLLVASAHGSAGLGGHRGVTVTQTVDGGRPLVNGELSPAALDAGFAAYSDQSACGDWAGGDGVSAVRLDASQIAWFFSDTYLGPARPASGYSRASGSVHNSIVIQTQAAGQSRFVTVTGGGTCDDPADSARGPTSIVGPQAPGGSDGRYWDEDGITIGGTIFKFYNRYDLGGPPPYIPVGTVLAAFPVGQLAAAGRGQSGGAVARPRITPLPSYTPPGDSTPIVWGAAVLRSGNTIYVYGTQTPDAAGLDRLLYLARVPASRLTQFTAWRFYAGGTWAPAQQLARPLQPAGSGLSVSTGFSVIQAGQRYWLIQADPLGGSQDIDAYPAATPWGPFDHAAGIALYRDPDIGTDAAHDYRIMYEARAELAVSTSSTLVISFNVNSPGVTAGCVQMSSFTNTVLQPRFVTVPMAVFEPGYDSGQDAATAGPGAPDYPHIAARDPSWWFYGWKYPGGCPPVPAVTSVRVQPEFGAIQLSWPDIGPGVSYRVYVLAPGATSYHLDVATGQDSAILTGLSPGTWLAQVVPVNLRHGTGPPAQVTFAIP